MREMREETGFEVEVGPVLEVFDRIERDADRGSAIHHVIVDYLCRAVAAARSRRAADDAADAVWTLDAWMTSPGQARQPKDDGCPPGVASGGGCVFREPA